MNDTTYKKDYRDDKVTSVADDLFEYIDFRNVLNDLYEGFLRFWFLLLLSVSLAATAGFLYKKVTYKPEYLTRATFFVDVNSAVEYENNNLSEKAMTQIATTFPYVINNQALQILIMDEFGVDEMPGSLYVRTMSDTNLITIQSIADTPETSYRLLQVVLENYPRVSKKILGNTSMKMIGESGMPDEPVSIDGAKSMAKQCAVICVAGWFCVVFLYSILKKTIRKEDDIQYMLNTHCFGSVPLVTFKKRSNQKYNQLLINQRSAGYEFSESIKTLRARIERDQNESGSKIYMFTSSLPSEGKSTLTANLAISFAEAGKKVILIDMDFRNSSICKILGIDGNKKGFTDIVRNNIEIEKASFTYEDNNNLVIIPSGMSIENIGRLLDNPNVTELFYTLRQKADILLIDTAPCGVLSDATVIAEHADAGIFVVCQDYAPVERIQESIDTLAETGLCISGCILNMCKNGIISYNRGYYGYSYGNKNRRYAEY